MVTAVLQYILNIHWTHAPTIIASECYMIAAAVYHPQLLSSLLNIHPPGSYPVELFLHLSRASGFSGMEWWTRTLEWNDGMDWNAGVMEWWAGISNKLASTIAVIGIVVAFTHGKCIHACV